MRTSGRCSETWTLASGTSRQTVMQPVPKVQAHTHTHTHTHISLVAHDSGRVRRRHSKTDNLAVLCAFDLS